jgi:hypothetical protein
MKKFVFISLLFCTTISNSQSLMLVSESEMVQSLSNPIQLIPKTVSSLDAPKIELLAPKLDASISSPTPIQLKFSPKSPATVNTDSFKVLYGTFQIDITNRILKVAQVSPSGIDVKEASLPRGNHKLTLNIQDSEGRLASKVIEFEIK